MTEATQAMTGADDVLRTAEELEGAGRPLDAIRLLTEANRTRRNVTIEQRLVRLRHEAFESIDHRAPGIPPPPITATRDEPGPLPDRTPDELTPAVLREGFERHGCVLVRGLVEPERVEQLVEGIDRALAAFDDRRAASGEEASAWYRHFKTDAGQALGGGKRKLVRASGGVWAVDSPRMLFELCELIDETGVGALVTEHLAERPALSANKCNLRRVPVDTSTNWHQDGAFLGTEVRSVNLWLGLSHCGRDAPGLDILPRRIDEVLETGTEGAAFPWSVSHEVVERVAETTGTPVQRPIIAPGDALLFDHMFLHRTGVDLGMTRERYAIETWFFAPSVYPDRQVPIVY